MKSRFWAFSIAFLAVLLISLLQLESTPGAQAKGPKPTSTPQPIIPPTRQPQPRRPVPPSSSRNPVINPTPNAARKPTPTPSKPVTRKPSAPSVTGGPDAFGYTWDDGVSINWIDATAGTNTGLTNMYDQVGPVSLPFAFDYYENTYSQIYIGASGVMGFEDLLGVAFQATIPDPTAPNNVIAPYWSLLDPLTGGIYYAQGGSSPDRWFAVEWYQVKDFESDSRLTFEVVLHENGAIRFQYQTLYYGGNRYEFRAGIEDARGQVGLLYTDTPPADNVAVDITRPPANGSKGSLGGPSQLISVQAQIRNTGAAGPDNYGLTLNSAWSASLYAADGVTAISNTGPLAVGQTITVTAKVLVPAGAVIGDSSVANLTATSSVYSGKTGTVALGVAVPPRFAQGWQDATDGAISAYLVQPNSQVIAKATGNGYGGVNGAIAEAPNRNLIYVWNKSRLNGGGVSISEIEFALMDRLGNLIGSVTRLTDNSAATNPTNDVFPVVAVAPNGRIGIAWYRDILDTGSSTHSYEVYFALLDGSGAVIKSPTQITTNGSTSELSNPAIVGTDDNRWIIAWQRSLAGTDISYAIYDLNANMSVAPTALTTSGNAFFHSANRVTGNAAILTWCDQSDFDIHYAVINSTNSLIRANVNLTHNGEGRWFSDAVALPAGRTAISWIYYDSYDTSLAGRDQVAFAILDRNFNLLAGPTVLKNPLNPGGNNFVSVTSDRFGRVVMTWREYDRTRNLYYALGDSNANILTAPIVFRSSAVGNIVTSALGYGNTSYSPWQLNQPLICLTCQ